MLTIFLSVVIERKHCSRSQAVTFTKRC